MDSHFEYSEDCIPDRWRVLDRMLLPFLVGHNLLLTRVQSPFAVGGAVNIPDLVLAVMICERSYEEGEKALLTGNTFRVRMFTRGTTLRAWIDKTFLKTHTDAFKEYVKKGERSTRGVWKDSKAERTYAPIIGVKIRDLMNHYGYTRSQVLNMSMRQANTERNLILERDRTITWPEPWETGVARG
jgi:hypothetical protein